MSRAFVKESEGDEGPGLPELRISEHRNLVTSRGHELIRRRVAALETELGRARAAEDRAATARIQRDQRYWSERLRTAELVPPQVDAEEARFGSTLTLEGADGRRVRYQIVGEDEAEPREGRLSYVSPVAQALLGAQVGDEIDIGGRAMEVVGIG
ncbi:MAG: GreA/GreB family elongation factor [Steroidobacteraceae bacterium]|jgi:transcription elongation GreA/GreB family factor|nr:GreA/GreB family elongation factor [Steroidobacteraceae bacterium]